MKAQNVIVKHIRHCRSCLELRGCNLRSCEHLKHLEFSLDQTCPHLDAFVLDYVPNSNDTQLLSQCHFIGPDKICTLLLAYEGLPILSCGILNLISCNISPSSLRFRPHCLLFTSCVKVKRKSTCNSRFYSRLYSSDLS